MAAQAANAPAAAVSGARLALSVPSESVASRPVRNGSVTGGAFSVLGKAMLGIAGAYLLRAVAESSLLPRTAVAAVAIAYALCGWCGPRG